MAKAKKSRKRPGPCPDPATYILVETKEGSFWRRKRGTVKPAILNEVFKRNTALISTCSLAAKRILAKLDPFTTQFDKGRIHSHLSGRLCKSFNVKGAADYLLFKGLDIQPDFSLSDILKAAFTVALQKGTVNITIPLRYHPVKRLSGIVTEYYFEAILVFGDPTKEGTLRIDSELSDRYSFDMGYTTSCTLSLQVPERKPWMVLLKVGCMEGKENAFHARHYGMRVVAVG